VPPRAPAAPSTLAKTLTLTGAWALAACATAGSAPAPRADPAPPAGLSEPAARATLDRFAQALQQGRWDDAWGLLSARWRADTSPERLAADWRGAGPVAPEAAARVRALLGSGAALEGRSGEGGGPVRLPVGGGRAARLVAEAGRWRVDALE